MKIIPFEELYHTDFVIREPFSKTQNWYSRNNVFNALGRPKPSHTLLWFKNCEARITDSQGRVLQAKKNQLVYMAKGIEYVVEFTHTAPDRTDSLVVHFLLTDTSGEELAPTLVPEVVLSDVDVSTALTLDRLAEECKKNVPCMPELTAAIYRIFSLICKIRHREPAKNKFACIRAGIELLENDNDMSIGQIAQSCGVSECYFRRLFKEYSGETPMEFRQKHRIDKARQLLLSDMYTVGEIAAELHFADIYHFSKIFKAVTGESPRQFTNRHRS